MTYRPRRSALFMPASNARAIEKARGLDCDVVILDLEDAVAPDAKTQSRDQAVQAIRDGGWGTRELVVRVNGLDTDWGAQDLDALSTVRPDAVLAPKVSTPAEVAAYSGRSGGQPLWIMVETARAAMSLAALAETSASTSLSGLVLGLNDLAAETGTVTGVDRLPFHWVLGQTVAAARANGLVALDAVFNALDDAEGFAEQAAQAVRFGFDGKTLIHPNQIAPCNAAFRPSAEAIETARRIVEAFSGPETASLGAIRLDGRMVERLHLIQAERTLAAAGL